MQPPPPSFFPPTDQRSVVLASHEFAPFRGGAATYVREVMLAARRLGYPVEVWTVDYGSGGATQTLPQGEPNANESSLGAKVVRLSSNGRLTPGGLLSLAWGFWRRRNEWRDQPVVLLSVGAQMAFFLLAMVGCKAREVTCVFYGSEVLRFQRNSFWRWLARRFYRNDTQKFAVITRYVESLLRESKLLPDDAQILLAPCALPSMFHVEQPGTPTFAATGTEADSEFRVLTVARLHPRKGQLEVARALGRLPTEQRARVIYQMVGIGDAHYREQIEAVCRNGGVRYEFLGALDDRALGTAYARATVCVQASRTLVQSVEGFGITFLEAGVYGCPVAAWRSGGVAEAVLDGETGLLVEEGDVEGLSKAVSRLLADSMLREKLGKRGREYALSLHWEEAARQLCGVNDE